MIRPSASRATGRPPAAAIAAVVAALVILAWSCKSPVVPSGGEADITVTSHWDTTVNVYMDGVFKFPLGYKESAEIDNVAVKDHEMEAKDAATGELVASTTLEVTDRSEYEWTIEHLARLNCENIIGETVHVYMDGVYQFDLADKENRWIIGVSLGDHFMMATRASDGSEVISAIIKVTENKDYGWGIHIVT